MRSTVTRSAVMIYSRKTSILSRILPLRMADAAEAARDELFRSDTPGATLLREVATQAYAIAYRGKDFVLGLAVRGQREVLDRQDRHEAKLDAILAAVHQREAVPLPTLQRILAGFGETEVAADAAFDRDSRRGWRRRRKNTGRCEIDSIIAASTTRAWRRCAGRRGR